MVPSCRINVDSFFFLIAILLQLILVFFLSPSLPPSTFSSQCVAFCSFFAKRVFYLYKSLPLAYLFFSGQSITFLFWLTFRLNFFRVSLSSLLEEWYDDAIWLRSSDEVSLSLLSSLNFLQSLITPFGPRNLNVLTLLLPATITLLHHRITSNFIAQKQGIWPSTNDVTMVQQRMKLPLISMDPGLYLCFIGYCKSPLKNMCGRRIRMGEGADGCVREVYKGMGLIRMLASTYSPTWISNMHRLLLCW